MVQKGGKYWLFFDQKVIIAIRANFSASQIQTLWE